MKNLCSEYSKESMSNLSHYIAPWALPKENIPIHLKWEDSFKFTKIVIDLPEDFIVNEFFNVEKVHKENHNYTIFKLKTSNFFGFKVAMNSLPSNIHTKKEIFVRFFFHEKEVFSKKFIANIYRPFVEFIDAPKTVKITDESGEHPQVSLKLSGFGTIQIRNKLSTGGDFFPRADPLYKAIIRRIISTFNFDDDEDLEKKGIRIDPEYLQKTANEYLERIQKNDVPLDIEMEDLKNFQQWVSNDENRAKIMQVISKNIESHIIDSILFYFEKYPEEDVSMPQGNPVMLIERATKKVSLRFNYIDAMKNEYEPIEVSIEVKDERTKKNQPMELPIKVKWEIKTINPAVECE